MGACGRSEDALWGRRVGGSDVDGTRGAPGSWLGWRAATILVASQPNLGGAVLLRGRRLDGEGGNRVSAHRGENRSCDLP